MKKAAAGHRMLLMLVGLLRLRPALGIALFNLEIFEIPVLLN
ncbi:hypothetical protein [Bradyrhizobium erythrophlei]|nr:hypothetical protein [Bradyrhizobium erythrophlei]